MLCPMHPSLGCCLWFGSRVKPWNVSSLEYRVINSRQLSCCAHTLHLVAAFLQRVQRNQDSASEYVPLLESPSLDVFRSRLDRPMAEMI